MTRRRHTDDVRVRLLEAGIAAFRDNGFHGTGIKAILDRVGIPKGSFYNYFESKDAFAVAAIEHYARCMGDKLGAALADAPSSIEGVRTFFRAELDAFVKADFVGGCLVANLGAELEGSAPCRAALAAALGGYVGGISTAIARAQEQGGVRSDISADVLGPLLVDAWEGAVIRMKIERSPAPLEQCLEQVLDGFFRP